MTHFEPSEGKCMKKTPNNERTKGTIQSGKANGYFLVGSGILQEENENQFRTWSWELSTEKLSSSDMCHHI